MKTRIAIYSVVGIAIVAALFMRFHPPGYHDGYSVPAMQVRNIKLAIELYEAAYSRLPFTRKDQDEQNNGEVMALLAPTSATTTNQNQVVTNIVFLSLSPGQATNGSFMDPWGQAYHIAMDVRAKGTVTVGPNEIRAKIAVWSDGPNGLNEFGGGDDIASWKSPQFGGR
jgi:hypothetical protein